MNHCSLYLSALVLVAACTPSAPKQMNASIDIGRELYTSKACSACHSVDGTPGLAPTLKGLYKSKVELSKGPPVIADEDYLRESIKEPNAKITKGYPAVMPRLNLLDEEVESLVLFIKSLDAEEKAPQS